MERGERVRKPNSEKHVFDVYVLTAMLTESELEEMEEVRAPYWKTPIRSEIQNCLLDLFGSEQSSGFPPVKASHTEVDNTVQMCYNSSYFKYII